MNPTSLFDHFDEFSFIPDQGKTNTKHRDLIVTTLFSPGYHNNIE